MVAISKFISRLILGLFFCLGTFNVSSQNIVSYHPSATALALGKSFDLFNLSVPYTSDIFKSFTPTSTGFIDQNVFISLVDSRTSLLNTLKMDAGMEGSFLSFGAHASYKKDESRFFNDNSLTVCLIGCSDFGNFNISNEVLNDGVEELAKKDPVAFKAKYGEYFVTGVHKMSGIFLLMTLRNVTQSVRQQLIGELGGGGGWGPFKAEAHGSLDKMLQEQYNSKNLTLTVRVLGNNTLRDIPIESISNTFFSVGNGLSQASGELLKYVSSNLSDPNKASVISYTFSPLSQKKYRDDMYFDLMRRKYQKYLAMCADYVRVDALLSEALRIKKYNTIDAITRADQDDLTRLINKYNDILDKCSLDMAKCKNATCQDMSCCNATYSSDYLEADRLHSIRNTYFNPLGDFNYFQMGTGPTVIQLAPGHFDALLFSSFNTKYKSLNIKEYNQQTYRILGNVNLVNNIQGPPSTFSVTLVINGIPMGSQIFTVPYQGLFSWNYASEAFPMPYVWGRPARLPESVNLVVQAQSFPVNSSNLQVLVLPGSNLNFDFANYLVPFD